ncbi:glycogen debranching enzyme-like isoform X2 [Leptotrombidium deliense]|uniref:Glycogen debranching enzyme n=1 Tax=Leptotrombidium deliense TaxID=299467 RepID=A0A443SJ72_9ACAR|nr:glycogen debranching enzyme-like isoform X2 [Leptotrombidium deliense]
MSTEVIKSLLIENNQFLESSLFRLKKDWKVRFLIGATLYGKQISLFINYPSDDCTFIRQTYRQLQWTVDNSVEYIEICFKLPGTFHYYYTENNNKIGDGYLLVEPSLVIGDDSTLTLDSIQCQTVISKYLGPFHEWKQRLKVAFETGYNMIHFTPVQELGDSKSAYSLRNQTKLNSMFETKENKYSFDDVSKLTEFMRKEWKILSITDIVLNHTANETDWLREHPECTYNLQNSPHLRPAYLLDRILWHVSMDIIAGKCDGLSCEINDESHLNRLREILHEYISKAKLYEMYQINVDEAVNELKNSFLIFKQDVIDIQDVQSDLIVIQDSKYRRFGSTVDMKSVFKKFASSISLEDEQSKINCLNWFRSEVEKLNNNIKSEIENHLNCAVESSISHIRYERVSQEGPKLKVVSRERPLLTQYFTSHDKTLDLKGEEEAVYNDEMNKYFMAHNGWVMNDNPLKNFAEFGSNVYLRRELIAWSDSVKLRFGDKVEDCPFLWNYMREYVEQTAKMFHGIRLDNCHSTPLHVAEYLIDAARKVRPDLYLIAELFTSSEAVDNIFVNRLGITSLIREAMAAPIPFELGRFIYRFGGDPTGSFIKVDTRPLIPEVAHAILFDLTHDNESPVTKRSAYDFLPTAAVVSMSFSATGSNRGYDELVPHRIDVVEENRQYTSWSDSESENRVNFVSANTGIILAKKALNNLHLKLGKEGFSEIFVDQVDDNVIAVTRHNPVSHKSVVLVARTSFSHPQNPQDTGFIRQITIAGKINQIILETKMIGEQQYIKDEKFINGLGAFKAVLKENISVENSEMVKITTDNGLNKVDFENFVPSSVIAFEVSLDQIHIDAVNELKSVLNNLSDLEQVLRNISLCDLNYVLFRIDQEEKDERSDAGVYNIPNFQSLNYCGIAGLMFYWKDIRTKDDLGHPICDNLRDGDWLPKYIADRLLHRTSTKQLGEWLLNAFNPLSRIPRFLIPHYFDSIITPLYCLLLDRLWSQCSKFVATGNNLVKSLVLGSIAVVGYNVSSPLPPLSNKLRDPKPEYMSCSETQFPVCSTIAAGFTHFASGYMRNWGRDTFISLRGLLLVTGRYEEARYIILGFAGCLRHGLIPNLLDRGIKARYNCRDAVWWWLQSIKDYCNMCPDGKSILQDNVRRLYPKDTDEPRTDVYIDQPLYEVMQESLQRQFEGIDFVERNAGRAIDEQMTEKGFHVKVGVNRETGFVFGGNEWNCGTWMDKMGSSLKAGNKGVPSSPRDGSAVELVGLSKSIITWLREMHASGTYIYSGVKSDTENWTWSQWEEKIQANFEKHFWISPNSSHHLVNRREIYKDSVGAIHEWRDYQLRPNFPIAMAVAPELFDRNHAKDALDIVQHVLVSALGMKTLDPSDWNYRGDYVNSDDSSDYKTAQGFNYHQGPEWLWPLGYYLRAYFIFSDDKSAAINYIKQSLSKHYKYIESSAWFGLPELTNSEGRFCADSCEIQAWSLATILDVLYDIQNQSHN